VRIALEKLHKRYGPVTAVESLSMTLDSGLIHALLGTNGAGKTTTLDCLVGVLRPTSGRILLDGKPVENLSQVLRGKIGFLPEGFEAFIHLSVARNVEYFQALAGIRKPIDDVLERLGLVEIAGRAYGQCSRGERLRTNLALTLVADPQVLILDEPTVGLDPAGRRLVWEIVRECRRAGKVILFSTHYMEEAEALADWLAVMNRGRIVAGGAVPEIVDRHSDSAQVVIRGLDRHDEGRLAERFPGYTMLRRGEETIVQVPNDSRMAEVVDAIQEQDLRCEEITCQRRSLETAFIRLTGQRRAS
jgi:ABC-2 type transport system ATP-binding protein